jgi:hypothetical protein
MRKSKVVQLMHANIVENASSQCSVFHGYVQCRVVLKIPEKYSKKNAPTYSAYVGAFMSDKEKLFDNFDQVVACCSGPDLIRFEQSCRDPLINNYFFRCCQGIANCSSAKRFPMDLINRKIRAFPTVLGWWTGINFVQHPPGSAMKILLIFIRCQRLYFC